ncbi:MAG: hypothetical protein V4446_05855 [Pseudomonadota bacterium]
MEEAEHSAGFGAERYRNNATMLWSGHVLICNEIQDISPEKLRLGTDHCFVDIQIEFDEFYEPPVVDPAIVEPCIGTMHILSRHLNIPKMRVDADVAATIRISLPFSEYDRLLSLRHERLKVEPIFYRSASEKKRKVTDLQEYDGQLSYIKRIYFSVVSSEENA